LLIGKRDALAETVAASANIDIPALGAIFFAGTTATVDVAL
jgi:hypothetical protein